MGVVIKRNTGERARKIAYKRGIPIGTVETIIKDYLADLIESLENKERINLDGITSITVVKEVETGEYVPRGRVSPALKSRLQKLEETQEKVESV